MFNNGSTLVKKKFKLSSGRHSKFDQNHLERSKFGANIPNLTDNDAYSKHNSLSFNNIEKEDGYKIFKKNYKNRDMKWHIPSPTFAARQGKQQKNLTL